MHKVNKLSFVLILAAIPVLVGYADTQVEVKGFAPQSRDCSGIRDQPLGLSLTMPASQYDPLKINSSQGFSFNTPVKVQHNINNEGVKGACDYYINPTEITVRGQKLTLERLLINSTATRSACTDVTATLSITTQNGSTCTITLTE